MAISLGFHSAIERYRSASTSPGLSRGFLHRSDMKVRTFTGTHAAAADKQVSAAQPAGAGRSASELAGIGACLVRARLAEGLYVVLSLPNFRLVRSRSLSLGAWVAKNLARRRKQSARPARAAWAVQRLLAARW